MAKRRINPEREQLLAEARRINRNAAAKVRRLALKGVKLTPGQDPRVAVAKLARMTAKQIMAHNERVQQFNTRRTQFVPGSEGQGLPIHKVRQLENLQRQISAKVDERMSEYGHLTPPGSGLSIRDREDLIVNHQARLHGSDARNKPYTKMHSKIENINGENALDELIAKAKKRLRKTYLPEELKRQREHARKMLDRIGNGELLEDFNKLTENQFDIWWNETEAANDLSGNYHTIMSMAAGSQERWYQQVLEDRHGDIKESISWAKNLPRTKRK